MITSCPRLFMQSSWRLLWRSKLLYSRSPNRKPRCGGARKTTNRHIHDLLWSSILHLLPDVTQKRQHFNDKLHDLYDGMSTSLSQKWTDPLDDQHPQELQQRSSVNPIRPHITIKRGPDGKMGLYPPVGAN